MPLGRQEEEASLSVTHRILAAANVLVLLIALASLVLSFECGKQFSSVHKRAVLPTHLCPGSQLEAGGGVEVEGARECVAAIAKHLDENGVTFSRSGTPRADNITILSIGFSDFRELVDVVHSEEHCRSAPPGVRYVPADSGEAMAVRTWLFAGGVAASFGVSVLDLRNQSPRPSGRRALAVLAVALLVAAWAS